METIQTNWAEGRQNNCPIWSRFSNVCHFQLGLSRERRSAVFQPQIFHFGWQSNSHSNDVSWLEIIQNWHCRSTIGTAHEKDNWQGLFEVIFSEKNDSRPFKIFWSLWTSYNINQRPQIKNSSKLADGWFVIQNQIDQRFSRWLMIDGRRCKEDDKSFHGGRRH